MTSIFSKFTRKSNTRIADDDNEKAATEYETDRTRLTKTPPLIFGRRGRGQQNAARNRYMGSFAPNPVFIRLLRFLLYLLASGSSLVTAGLGIAVVYYYNHVGPVIKPSWGSLIACIVFGIITPGGLFGTLIVTPFLFRRPGSFLYIINQTRIELLLLFSLAAIWVSGAIALAADLRGRAYCLWDGFYHYPKPDDFDHVCNLINYMVALAYTTFGLVTLAMVVVFLFATYILLYLDQEVLTEPTNDMGGRAYRARMAALADHRAQVNADTAEVSTAGPFRGGASSTAGPMAGGVPASRQIPHDAEGGPMMTGGSRSASRSLGSRSHSGHSSGRPLEQREDEERGPSELAGTNERADDDFFRREEDPNSVAGEGYYGFENANRMGHGRV